MNSIQWRPIGRTGKDSHVTKTTDSLETLRVQLAQFAAERDWEQFHNPKNLAMAVAGEAGELIEHFQWLTPEQAANLPRATRDEVALECADVLLFLLRLCDRLGHRSRAGGAEEARAEREEIPGGESAGRATKYDKL